MFEQLKKISIKNNWILSRKNYSIKKYQETNIWDIINLFTNYYDYFNLTLYDKKWIENVFEKLFFDINERNWINTYSTKIRCN